MPNLKMKNKNKKKKIVTILRSHRWPYIKSMVTQMKKMDTVSAKNAKHSTQIIFI